MRTTKRKHLGAVFIALLIVMGLVAPASAGNHESGDKVKVCKYVAKPGPGGAPPEVYDYKNEIIVDRSSAPTDGFSDAQPSLVVELNEPCPLTIGGCTTNCGSNTVTDPVVVTVDLTAGAVCVDETDQLEYLAGGDNWTTGSLTVSAGGADLETMADVANGSFGMMAWPVDAEGALYASVTLTLSAEDLSDAVTVPLPDDCVAVAVDEPEPDEVLEEEEETLPETGASALLLSLLGLLSMGTGGALLRRRR
jgi:LPXTG-motif cell wall-anchored protein